MISVVPSGSERATASAPMVGPSRHGSRHHRLAEPLLKAAGDESASARQCVGAARPRIGHDDLHGTRREVLRRRRAGERNDAVTSGSPCLDTASTSLSCRTVYRSRLVVSGRA